MHDELAGIDPRDKVLDCSAPAALLASILGWLAAARNVLSVAAAASIANGSGTAVTSSEGFIMIHGFISSPLFFVFLEISRFQWYIILSSAAPISADVTGGESHSCLKDTKAGTTFTVTLLI